MKSKFKPIFCLLKLLRCFTVFLIAFFLHGPLVYGQIKNSEKLSPALQKGFDLEGENVFFIAVKDPARFYVQLKKQDATQLLHVYLPAKTFLIRTKAITLNRIFLPDSNIVFVDAGRAPREELFVGNYDLGTNKINTVHNEFSSLNGEGHVLSIKEQKMDTADIDLKGRHISTPVAASNVTAHATIMSTIAAGGGNSFFQGKGAAWGSMYSSSNFQNLLPDADAVFTQNNISVQNHSYGTGIENFYGADAAAYDISSSRIKNLLHVFSAGNAGTSTSNAGAYAGIAGYANLTGSFKMAKNIITVGHTDSFGSVLPLSSAGPAHDGRLKPELVAFGEDGSSGAAALVSGVSILLQHAFRTLHGEIPNSDLVRAVLLNGADDLESAGIDFRSGYGGLNAYKSLLAIIEARYFRDSVDNASFKQYDLSVPAGSKRLKILLTWNDPAAGANAAKALVNDLDLSVTHLGSGNTFLPWVLNHAPHIDSLQQLPSRKKDSLNNTEQVTIENPAPGVYSVRVSGFNVTASNQKFVVTFEIDTVGTFKWFYPGAGDNLKANQKNTLRWESNLVESTGALEYTIDGNNWSIIDNTVDLAQGFYQWEVPVNFQLAMVRMKVNSIDFLTDTFSISAAPQVKVGFNCPDSFLLQWNEIPGVATYRVFNLGDRYLEPVLDLPDTFFVFNKTSFTSLHFAVAPVINGKPGEKSRTFNYTTQGVECYTRSFLATLTGNAVRLDLELGTLYRVNRILWEKLTSSGYQILHEIPDPLSLTLTYTDANPSQGVNTYRVRIVLQDGRAVYTQPETVYFFIRGNYIIYPNPARVDQQINLLNKDVSQGTLQVFNAAGVKVYERVLDDALVSLPAGLLKTGVYLVRILPASGKAETIKLLIY